MFKIQRQNECWTLLYTPTRFAVHSPTLESTMRHMALIQAIRAGKSSETLFEIAGGARKAGWTIQTLRKGMIPNFPDVLVLRAAELGMIVDEYDSVEELERGIAHKELCEICGGQGSLEYPAENRGGEIFGPDSEVCRACRGTGKNPQA